MSKQGKNVAEGLETEVAPVLDTTVDTDVAADKGEAKKATKKVLTEEDVAALNYAVDNLHKFQVSPEFQKIAEIVRVWHLPKDENKEAVTAVIEDFGGIEKFKEYIGTSFEEEISNLMAIAKVFSPLNNIKSFYKRRKEVSATRKSSKKKMTIVIGGETYKVNTEYFESLANVADKDEKRQAILAHADTVKDADVVEL